MARNLIPRELIDEIRSRASIARVIGKYVELDSHMAGCCPFHEDANPSFSIHRKGQYFNCFGCGAAGDVFRFVELYYDVPFPEAVAAVASEVGVVLPFAPDQPLPMRTRPSRPSADGPLSSPPPGEDAVTSVWNDALPVSEVEEAWEWFRFRFRDQGDEIAGRIDDWDLARVLQPGVTLPSWANLRGSPWSDTGYRLIFRLWDHNGRPVSLRARSLRPDDRPKSLAPTGHSIKGCVLADPLAVQILSGAVPAWWTNRMVVISEGEPDWIAWAGRQSDAHEEGPSYIGIEAGSWTQAIADRMPTGAEVIIRTHDDMAGERYASKIAASLADRCILYRTIGEKGVAA